MVAQVAEVVAVAAMKMNILTFVFFEKSIDKQVEKRNTHEQMLIMWTMTNIMMRNKIRGIRTTFFSGPSSTLFYLVN